MQNNYSKYKNIKVNSLFIDPQNNSVFQKLSEDLCRDKDSELYFVDKLANCIVASPGLDPSNWTDQTIQLASYFAAVFNRNPKQERNVLIPNLVKNINTSASILNELLRGVSFLTGQQKKQYNEAYTYYMSLRQKAKTETEK